MAKEKRQDPVMGMIVVLLVLVNVIILKAGYINNERWYRALVLTVPLLLLASVKMRRHKHAVSGNLFAEVYSRYILNRNGKPRKYFFEFHLTGKPSRTR
ncbi:MAG: hypothetical protein H7Y31_04100, partial [Chitinophagaceae bacterium]|nr:hypothetical protein [Chitinophagaceae bacterium]